VYICCSLQQMQEHFGDLHQWKSEQKGDPVEKTPDQPAQHRLIFCHIHNLRSSKPIRLNNRSSVQLVADKDFYQVISMDVGG
jgi:hypothetical protein